MKPLHPLTFQGAVISISRSEETSSIEQMAHEQLKGDNSTEQADPSPLLRGIIWGGFLTVGAALVLLGVRRMQKQEMVFNGELGSIRISQSALEKLMSSHCEKISGVADVECRVKIKRNGAEVTLNACLQPDCDPASVMGQMVSGVYKRLGGLLSLTPEGLSVSVREVKMQQMGG